MAEDFEKNTNEQEQKLLVPTDGNSDPIVDRTKVVKIELNEELRK